MALLGIIFPLFLSLLEQVTSLLKIIPVPSERESEEDRPEQNHFAHDRDLNPRPLSSEPRVLSLRPWRPASVGLNVFNADLFT